MHTSLSIDISASPSIDVSTSSSIDSVETENLCAYCNVLMGLTHQSMSISSQELPLRWRDGPAADGELARTLLLLEQRHLDTLAQMAADPAEVLQGAGPCSIAAWSMGHGGGVGQDGTGCWGGLCQTLRCFARVIEVVKQRDGFVFALAWPRILVANRWWWRSCATAADVEPPHCPPFIHLQPKTINEDRKSVRFDGVAAISIDGSLSIDI
ncbi:hypothetical protein F2Q69_00023405 [Brassica cretica]|uniref:Uncharacterized protein n=1 Tax=Brassica cretica TaxID=69181 RepID=A0A8S9QHW4_BRACR|nr:hypothetical protein F2Q69_00023405 [Brassica cretica]